jgi:glutamine synthetase
MRKDPFFEQNLDIEDLEVFIVDVNGVLRGKNIPCGGAGKAFDSGIRLPRSVFAVDIWGRDVLAAGLVAETGDNDGICRVVPASLHRVLWADRPVAQVLLSPWTGKCSEAEQILGMRKMEEFDWVLSEIIQCCRAHGIPTDATSSENGPAQFEINLHHVPDALKAADHATMMKRVVSGIAAKHGMEATFMAKPYGDKSGSGMHVHFSILDKNGNNIFAGKDKKGSARLKYAIGGLLAGMSDSIAILAPNANSYRRFRAGSHAPTKITWGYDNRSASLRVPESDLASTRIEYWVPGADANPYLGL